MTVSARGLFRATGKRPKKVAVRDLLTGEIRKEEGGLEREKDEFYPTPSEPTRAILWAERDRLKDFPIIWEPAAGDGAMLREMRVVGHKVHGSDLIDRGCGAEIRDFFSYTRADRPSSCIFTNPPFNLVNGRDGKGAWLYHALDALEAEYVALLLPWGFPGAAGLRHLWAKHPPARVYLMRWRIDFTGQGAAPNLNAFFIWDKAWTGETALRMLDRADARQSSLFRD